MAPNGLADCVLEIVSSFFSFFTFVGVCDYSGVACDRNLVQPFHDLFDESFALGLKAC